jgi:hypothetical protein
VHRKKSIFGGHEQAAAECLQAIILSPFAVILSAAKDLRSSLWVSSEKNLGGRNTQQLQRSFAIRQ